MLDVDDGCDLTEADAEAVRLRSLPPAVEEPGGRYEAPIDPTIYTSRLRRLVLPIGYLSVIALPLPAARGLAAAGRRWQRRHVPPGHCRRCGYDLRASPGRCPECGAAGVTIG